MGLNSLLSEVIDQNGGTNSDEDTEEKPVSDSADNLSAFDALKAGVNSEATEDGAIKAQDDAIDYSDINELSEDCPRTPSPPAAAATGAAEEATTSASTFDDLEDAIPASKVEAKLSKCTNSNSPFHFNNCMHLQPRTIRNLCRRQVHQ